MQAIVDICNQIDGSAHPRFRTLKDIRKQWYTGTEDSKYHDITANCMINITPNDLGGYKCIFIDMKTAINVELQIDSDGKITAHGLVYNYAEGATSIRSNGAIHIRYLNNDIIYSDVVMKDTIDIAMGGHTFHIPSCDNRLFDRSIYKELYKFFCNEKGYFVLAFHIDRSAHKACISMSQVEPGAIVKKQESISIDFEASEEAKNNPVIDLIMPLIDAVKE